MKSFPWLIVLAFLLFLSLALNAHLWKLNQRQLAIIEELTLQTTRFGTFGGAEGSARIIDTKAPSLRDDENQSRILAGNAASNGNTGCSGSSSAGGHHGPHQQDSLLYMFNAIVLGAVIMQVSERYPVLQQTVVLFMLGFFASLLLKGANVKDEIAVWGESYEMWMQIDPHLLLFTLLPALLAGDAMTIDTSVARRAGFQCLFLAGPGVLVCGMTTAAFLSWYLDWSFLLSLCAGAIMCATDPVAVVALLKELGASPMLTVQIQGESLLNDGTAIVLYLISYNMLSGKDYDAADIAMFLVKKAMMAWALGLFIGYFFFSWIRAVSNKLSHSSSMIQITLTLCSAYWSFIFVEGVLELSGVLATVASSLVLAHHMWPHIVSHDSMLHVWHTFESLGNIIVFFLAGSLTGWIFLDIDAIDCLHLLVIYVFLLLLRGSLIFGSRPILRRLGESGEPITWQDATLMTWGGLRGAVGLALAIQVNNDRAPNDSGVAQIDATEAKRLLFFVSGIAFLTTVINATSAPWLVQKLGITAPPHARHALVRMFFQQIVSFSNERHNPPEVTARLKEALSELDHERTDSSGPKSARHGRTGDVISLSEECQSNPELLEEFFKEKAIYEQIPKSDFELLGKELPDNILGQISDMTALVKDQWVDEGMAKVVNQVFLSLVQRNYWRFIEDGDLRPGSPESEVLLTSVRLSLSPYRQDLVDFKTVLASNFSDEPDGADEFAALGHSDGLETQELKVLQDTGVGKLVTSWQFNFCVALLILLNSVQVVVEEVYRNDDNDDHIIWLILDACFTVLFSVEFVLKFAFLKCKYFLDNWNRFDFSLVFIGVAGVVLSAVTRGSNAASQTRIIRVARVLRTLRFLRVFRLLHARMSSDKYVSMELARRMKQIVTLSCFIRAHLKAQIELVKYFGGNGRIDDDDEAELARCIIQSQVATYKALTQAAATQRVLGTELLNELKTLYKRKTITEELTKFVLGAHEDGAITSTEAHKILHPLHHEIAECMYTLSQRAEGVLCRDISNRNYGGKSDSSLECPRTATSVEFHDPTDNLAVVPT